MRDLFSNQKINKYAKVLLLAMVVTIAGCTSGTSTSTSPTTTTPTTTIAAPTIALALTDPTTGLTTTSTPAKVKATVLDATGAPVSNTVVTFSVTNTALATLTPSSGTALTIGGVSSIGLNATNATVGGATTVTASALVGTTTVTMSIGFNVNASAPATGATISAPTFGVGASPLSAYGTTSVVVNVTPTTTPLTVTFTSTCASTGKATLTPSVVSVSGVATGSYLDNGCGATDTITATVSGTTTSASSALVVTPPATGSLQYISSTPSTISLQGTGGITTSQVVFKVVDAGGNPLGGKIVTFGLSTTVGGITFTPNVVAPTATSNGSGLVSISVNSGTVSTPVRVTASTCTNGTSPCTGTTLTTQSNQLTISTGIPDQDSFSLSATTINTEGWNIDGVTSTLSARLSDHFNNPVPDGTAVNFTTEGGSIVASCTTTSGGCSSLFTTQSLRPTNGRVTVLAYAVGEESFTDLNGNGVADLAAIVNSVTVNEMRDANGASTDMPEAFVDYNEDGVRQNTEPFIDFNQDGTYNAADGQFNGVLCSTLSSAGTCSTTKTIHVRRSIVLTMSSSSPFPLMLLNNASPPVPVSPAIISLPACDNPANLATLTGPIIRYYIRILDVNGNAMPEGTTISFATTNGTLASPSSYTLGNTSGCSSAFAGCPASAGSVAFEYYPIDIQSDATSNGSTCTNSKSSGIFTVNVKTPGGAGIGSTTTTTTFVVND
jgi:hypothetical protein